MNRNYLITITICILFIQDTYAQINNSTTNKTIKIGLLINNNRSFEARNGAQLAISKANEKNGSDGPFFQLDVRSMEGPWGTGSKEAVNLVFKENVWALLGSHDGRNAHLVEQVIAKTQIVFLSAWASDPTLSKAFVPWYFSCVPNDLQQADTLIKEIYSKRKISKIAIVSDSGYDSRMALESFIKKLKLTGKPVPIQLFYKNPDSDFNILINKLKKTSVNGVLLFGQSTNSLKFIEQLRLKKMDQPVFGNLSIMEESEFSKDRLSKFEDTFYVSSVNWLRPNVVDFKKEFQRKYGRVPTEVAAYAFDGMNLIIEAIRSSKFDREKIQEALSKIHYIGVTGGIRFDERGNRISDPEIKELKNGHPVSIKN